MIEQPTDDVEELDDIDLENDPVEPVETTGPAAGPDDSQDK